MNNTRLSITKENRRKKHLGLPEEKTTRLTRREKTPRLIILVKIYCGYMPPIISFIKLVYVHIIYRSGRLATIEQKCLQNHIGLHERHENGLIFAPGWRGKAFSYKKFMMHGCERKSL